MSDSGMHHELRPPGRVKGLILTFNESCGGAVTTDQLLKSLQESVLFRLLLQN